MRFLRTVLAAGLLAGSLGHQASAFGQSTSDLVAGRQLFAEALSDEEHGRFAAALEKFKRVQAIKDTTSVRYRIGTSYEGLGRVAHAVDAYSAAIRLGSESPADRDIVRGAQARLDVLRPKVAHLALLLPAGASADAEIAIDGEPVARDALADVSVDPGAHVVTATAKDTRPFRAQITLSEGGRAEIPIVLEAAAAPPPPPPPPDVVTPSSPPPYKTIGIVTAAAGGALIIGGVVALVLRHGAISKLSDHCPNGNCPAAQEQDLRSTRDRAVASGTVGAVLLITGIAAASTGIVLVVVKGNEPKTAMRLVPSPISHGAAFTLTRAF